jgi:hypothetical protein
MEKQHSLFLGNTWVVPLKYLVKATISMMPHITTTIPITIRLEPLEE